MPSRIQIFSGGFGSGKTELALHQALKSKNLGERVVIIDLDMINPYFRSQDFSLVQVIAAKEGELPSLTAEIHGALRDKALKVVMDLGGNQEGALVVGSLSEEIRDYEMNFVYNPFRPFGDVPGSSLLLKQIQAASRLKVTHLIGNINLGDETTFEHIKKGYPLLKELAERLQLPIKYLVLKEDLFQEAEGVFLEEILPLKRHFRPPWFQKGVFRE